MIFVTKRKSSATLGFFRH